MLQHAEVHSIHISYGDRYRDVRFTNAATLIEQLTTLVGGYFLG